MTGSWCKYVNSRGTICLGEDAGEVEAGLADCSQVDMVVYWYTSIKIKERRCLGEDAGLTYGS